MNDMDITTITISNLKITGTRRLKPALPEFQRGNINAFVEMTVLADFVNGNNYNFDQKSSLQAVRNLISACICYLVDFQNDKGNWLKVYNMIACCVDENHTIPENNPLDLLFQEVSRETDDCYCKTLYDCALVGGAYHIPSTFGKALRVLSNYIFC